MKPLVDLQVLYLLATTVTLFVLAAMAGFGLHARREAVGRAFAAVSASAACWTATVALLALSTPEAALFWLKVKYTFIAFTPVMVVWFALEFTGSMPVRRGWVLAALSVIPTLRLALLWTDAGRGWLIREVVFERTGSLTHVGHVVYGPLHPYAITYNYLLIVGAVLLVLMWAARTGPLALPQGLALAGAAVAPVVANSATLLGATPPDMDPMPLALAMTGALICWSVGRHGMLETVPIARDVLLDAIEDGMLATDANGRVIDMNRTMSALLGVPVSSALGRPVSALFAAAGEHGSALADDQGAAFVTLRERHFAVRTVPLHAGHGPASGRLLLLHDMTARLRMEDERELLITELRHALAQIRTLSGLLPVCASCKSIRDGKGRWRPADEYLRDHSGATVSHGMCPECSVRLYPSAYRETRHEG
jgi:PAS domain-containing protein